MTTTTRTTATAGRRADSDRRYERVHATIVSAVAAGAVNTLNVAGIARAAAVHRTYLYRHPDLLDLIHQAAATPLPGQDESDRVTAMSLRADLAHARDRAARAEAYCRTLQRRLSEALGEQVWAATGLGPLEESAALHRDLEQVRQQLVDRTNELEERTRDLEAARTANRELMAQLNSARST